MKRVCTNLSEQLEKNVNNNANIYSGGDNNRPKTNGSSAIWRGFKSYIIHLFDKKHNNVRDNSTYKNLKC